MAPYNGRQAAYRLSSVALTNGVELNQVRRTIAEKCSTKRMNFQRLYKADELPEEMALLQTISRGRADRKSPNGKLFTIPFKISKGKIIDPRKVFVEMTKRDMLTWG